MNAMTSVELTQTNMMIPLSSILPLPFGNCRNKRNSEKYQELLNSIKTRGVIQPILVRPSDDKFEVIAGYGRLEASTELGLDSIPAFVKILSDAEALEHQIEENLCRDDLSIIDECKAVQQLSAFYNGDRQAIADRLVWPMRKVNERIEILRCTSQVLEAVGSGAITVGHALLLAPFSEKLQQGTLAKVIAEKWTVAYLRERASKGQQLLSLAKFDTSECNTCPHNSAAQSGLFGLDDHKAACSKLTCFKEKTNEWLEVRKDELADQYGTVLLIQQVAQEDRNTVDSASVGEEQFNSGCMTCEKRVALIDDRLGRSLGTTYTNQCIDAICYNNCVKALSEPEPETPHIEEVGSDAIPLDDSHTHADTINSTSTVKPKVAKTKKAVNCSVSSKVVETNKRVLRNVGAELLMPNPHFQSAMTYAALRGIASGYKPLVSELSSTAHFSQVLKSAIALDEATLMAEIANVTLHLSTKQSDDSLNFTDMMISLLPDCENSLDAAIKKWMPTKEILSQYTIDGIKVLCVESGFEAAFDAAKSGEFAKLTGKGKATLIDTILKFDFDWSGFAPKEYIALIK
ncbi:PRTRC system ParB family protein [Shewanella aestuarii]|uniref:PRTRC system ParB family protein n=1 Tax=Shewanella aestuarii TaxID=1028752 RepID=A0A6G9QPS2_9GAMM|nr:PRTRC system ParB family protein [Shewanella aestuarii]QIR16472.1 PRTRC system ParB family protein [Shewanella aestuarii]